MTNKEILEKFRKRDIAGCWPDFGGIDVVQIEYGIDDMCLCVTNTKTQKPVAHQVKIYTDAQDNAFIILYGRRLYLSSCSRKIY